MEGSATLRMVLSRLMRSSETHKTARVAQRRRDRTVMVAGWSLPIVLIGLLPLTDHPIENAT
jgi:hypothetical protein